MVQKQTFVDSHYYICFVLNQNQYYFWSNFDFSFITVAYTSSRLAIRIEPFFIILLSQRKATLLKIFYRITY